MSERSSVLQHELPHEYRAKPRPTSRTSQVRCYFRFQRVPARSPCSFANGNDARHEPDEEFRLTPNCPVSLSKGTCDRYTPCGRECKCLLRQRHNRCIRNDKLRDEASLVGIRNRGGIGPFERIIRREAEPESLFALARLRHAQFLTRTKVILVRWIAMDSLIQNDHAIPRPATYTSITIGIIIGRRRVCS